MTLPKGNYQKWNCDEHGFYRFKEKYLVNCQQCFDALKKELSDKQERFNTLNSELVGLRYEFTKLKEIKADQLVTMVLKEMSDK